jgi:transcriptional regulator with XRE-family HTH domain
MGTRNGPTERARRRIEADLHGVRADLGVARRSAGLSLERVAEACGVASSTASRTESGTTQDPDLRLLASTLATVGLELRLRAYLSGDPLRDAGQQRLLERLRARLHPGLDWQTEVPLPIDGDLRAWDAVISGGSWRLAVEAETVLDDAQALERRLSLKRRDGGIERVILLLAETRRNRLALASAPAAFSGFSRDARGVLRALRTGDDPVASAIVLL